MRSTPKYTRMPKMGVLDVLRCTSGPGATRKKQKVSRARGIEKYTKVHQVHPDQIGTLEKKYTLPLVVAS